MGVYIPNTEMPRKCIRCPLNGSGTCFANGKDVLKATVDAVKDKDCPLAEVKTPHGRLGDLDELRKWHKDGYVDVGSIDHAPTIIESEGENKLLNMKLL